MRCCALSVYGYLRGGGRVWCSLKKKWCLLPTCWTIAYYGFNSAHRLTLFAPSELRWKVQCLEIRKKLNSILSCRYVAGIKKLQSVSKSVKGQFVSCDMRNGKYNGLGYWQLWVLYFGWYELKTSCSRNGMVLFL